MTRGRSSCGAAPDATDVSKCLARTFIYKALIGVAILPISFVVMSIGLARGGATLLDVPGLIYAGELSWWKQLIGWFAHVVVAVRYVPVSWYALRHGACAIGIGGDAVILPGRTRIAAGDVASVRPVSGIFRKGIVIRRHDGREHYVCSIPTTLNDPSALAEQVRRFVAGERDAAGGSTHASVAESH